MRVDVSIFFFFQAEDGIRDKLVTGVQTCALPISWSRCGLMEEPAFSCIRRTERSGHCSCSSTWRMAGQCCSRGRRSEEHTSELQSLAYLVCRLLLEKKKKTQTVTREDR